jgi:hypothetical protein
VGQPRQKAAQQSSIAIGIRITTAETCIQLRTARNLRSCRIACGAGADALIWGNNGTSDHLWQLVSAGSGEYKIENYNSGLLLGVTSESKASGAQVLQWTDNGTADHLWTLTAS